MLFASKMQHWQNYSTRFYYCVSGTGFKIYILWIAQENVTLLEFVVRKKTTSINFTGFEIKQKSS